MNVRGFVYMLTAAAACLATWGASADTASDPPKMVVNVVGYDLSTTKGAEALYNRIEAAAEVVCRVNQSREQQRMARARVCFRSAVADAVAQVNQPLLSMAHVRAIGSDDKVIRAAQR